MVRTFSILAFGAVSFGIAASSAAGEPPPKPAPTYKACPADKVWSESQNGCICAAPTTWDDRTRKCVGATNGPVPTAPPRDVKAKAKTCAPGKQWSDAHGTCVVACAAGKVPDAKGVGCVAEAKTCPLGKVLDARGMCANDPVATTTPDDDTACAAGTEWSDSHGMCVAQCPPGKTLDGKGTACVNEPKACPSGKEWKDAFDGCVPICAADQVLDFRGLACHPIKVQRRPR